jgi:hypothetical protein
MTEITTFKIHSEPTFIIWNEMDDELIVATDSDQIVTFKVSETLKSQSIKIPEKINMLRIDYSTKKLLVSTDQNIYIINN